MPKCPKCNAEIDCLHLFESGDMQYRYNGETYESKGFIPDCGTPEYACPECDEVVASCEDEAMEILGVVA